MENSDGADLPNRTHELDRLVEQFEPELFVVTGNLDPFAKGAAIGRAHLAQSRVDQVTNPLFGQLHPQSSVGGHGDERFINSNTPKAKYRALDHTGLCVELGGNVPEQGIGSGHEGRLAKRSSAGSYRDAMPRTNTFGQPIGDDLDGWEPPSAPPAQVLSGNHVRLEPLDVDRHGSSLFSALNEAEDSLWTYMSWGPFSSLDELSGHLTGLVHLPNWIAYAALIDGEAVGYFSYLRIDPPLGSIEVGGITLSPRIQRTIASTEAQYLLMRNAFELGYRRYEWKCDALNAPSRSAALRLGFTYEGTFRQATHYKGRNRDTAWYAITDRDWPKVERAFLSWLAPENFDEAGTQREALQTLH